MFLNLRLSGDIRLTTEAVVNWLDSIEEIVHPTLAKYRGAALHPKKWRKVYGITKDKRSEL